MSARLLHWQGALGLALAAALMLLLAVQKGESRHWRRQSGHYEQLYRAADLAHARTVADYRAAAAAARAADATNAARTAAEQRRINESTADAFQTRLAAARAVAERLRGAHSAPTADPGTGRGAPVPALSAPPGGAAPAPRHDRLSRTERLTATEQAIQLDELIRWVRRQHAVAPDRPPR